MRKCSIGGTCITLVDFFQKVAAVTDGSIVITVGIVLKKESAHGSTGISMRLTEVVYSIHTCGIVTVSEHVDKSVGGIIITYGNHRIQIIVDGVSSVCITK